MPSASASSARAPERTHVTGNLKFDFALPADVTTKGRELREHYASGRLVWVAGSTHGDGEEESVLAAHRHVRQVHPNALLVLVPRKPQRFAEVGAWLEKQNVRFIRRSQPAARTRGSRSAARRYARRAAGFLRDGRRRVRRRQSRDRWAGTTCSSPRRSAFPCWRVRTTSNGADIAKILVDCGAALIVKDATELGARVARLSLQSSRTRADGRARPRLRRRKSRRAREAPEPDRSAAASVASLVLRLRLLNRRRHGDRCVGRGGCRRSTVTVSSGSALRASACRGCPPPGAS